MKSLVQAKTQSQVQKLEDATKPIPGVEAGIVIYGLHITKRISMLRSMICFSVCRRIIQSLQKQ